MAYCTQTDIQNLELTPDELVDLTDDAGAGSVDPDKVAAAITRASADVDKYCAGRYDVPFAAPAPALVNGWACTLAAFYLHRNRPKPATLIDRYNKAMADLVAVSVGDLDIPGVTDSTLGAELPESTTSGLGFEFTRGQYDTTGTEIPGTQGTMDTW